MVEKNKVEWFEGIDQWDECRAHGSVEHEWHIPAPEVLNSSIAEKLEAQLNKQKRRGAAISMFGALRTYNLQIERIRLERMDSDVENHVSNFENDNANEEENLINSQAERSDMVIESEKCSFCNIIKRTILSFCCCTCGDTVLKFRRYGRYILVPNIERQITETFER